MKMLYRYFVVHEDIRNVAAVAGSRVELLAVCQALRDVIPVAVDHDVVYTSSWYTRHRQTSIRHAHSGRVSSDDVFRFLRDKAAENAVLGEEYEDSGVLGALFAEPDGSCVYGCG